MKNKEQKQVTAGVNPQALVAALLKNKAGGEITLEDFQAKCGTFSKPECLTVIREQGCGENKGIFIIGRRGLKSRWVYGAAAQDVMAKTTMRHVRLAAPQHRAAPAAEASATISGGGLSIVLKLGEQVLLDQNIPLSVGVAQAA